MVEKRKNGNHAQRPTRELKNETYLRSNFQRRSLGSLFSVDDGVPTRGEMVTVSFTERNFFKRHKNISALLFLRKETSAFLCFLPCFLPLSFEKFWEGKRSLLWKKDLNRERKKKSDIDAT